MNKTKRQLFMTALAGAAGQLMPSPVLAQRSGQLRIILPVGVGSTIDIAMRAVAPLLTQILGMPTFVENRVGASGTIGVAALAKAPPDGSTIAVISNAHLIAPLLYRNLPYDAMKDVIPVTVLGNVPLVLVCNPKLPANNIPELVRLLSNDPGKYNYASPGRGTVNDLAANLFFRVANVRAENVFYNGTAQQLTALIAGESHFGIGGLATFVPQVKSGALRALGLCGAARTPAQPEIPTIAEQGYPGFELDAWIAVLAPAGTPDATMQRLNTALKTAFADEAVRRQMEGLGNYFSPLTTQASAALFATESAKYASLITGEKTDIR